MKTWRQFRIEYLAYARLHANRLDILEKQSLAMIQSFANDRNGIVKLSYSGGKDSTLLMHLARQTGIDFVPIWFADPPLPGTLEIMSHYDVKIIHYVNWYNNFRLQYGQLPVWSDRPPMHATIDYERELDTLYGITGTLVGMRRSESIKRRYALKEPIRQLSTYAGGWRCAPLAAWKTEDVWAYTFTHDIPLHPHYQRLIDIGAPEELMRVDSLPTLFCSDYVADRSLAYTKTLYPTAIGRFIDDNPYLHL